MGTERMACETLYVYEDGFYYRERPEEEWIPLSKKQYYRAVEIIKEQGSRLNVPKDLGDYSRFLLDGLFIELNGSSSLHEGKNPKTILIMTEPAYSDINTKTLAEKLDLPLPR